MIFHKGESTATIAAKDYPIGEWEIGDKGSFLPSGVTKNVVTPMNEMIITDEMLVAIQLEIRKLFVIGEARYKDFQGKEQIFPFFTVYDPNYKDFEECRE